MSQDEAWSEQVRLDRIGAGISRRLVADEAARSRIAKALDLQSLRSLEAHVTLKPSGLGWRLAGDLKASVVQTCGLTLEPLPAAIATEFGVDLVEASEAPEREQVIEADPDTPDGPDEIEDGTVDLAAYVVEHLALSLDPWPRKPGAVFEPPPSAPEPSPFDVLKSLKPKS